MTPPRPRPRCLPLRLACLLGLAAAATAAIPGRVAMPPADRPNIVVIIADDLGAEDCGPFGNRPVRNHIVAEHNWHDFDAHGRAVRTEQDKYIRNYDAELPATPPDDAVRSPTFQAMRRERDAGRLPPEQLGCFTRPRPAEELYDLAMDPHELRNLAADPRQAETLGALRARLAAWQRETADPVPSLRAPDEFDRETGQALPNRGRARPTRKQLAPPGIVLIYADDLGYGDVGCYGATAVRTPHIDRLAREGLRFTDAHAAAATCTPSRYALLTGEYAWRRKGTGVLPGDAALIIAPGRTTLATLLQRAGYRTGVVGKWHLGLGPPGGPDWNGEVKPGPLEIGFDDAFVIPATGDRVPCVYVENRRVAGLDPADPIRVSFGTPVGDEPTGRARPDLLTLHPSHGHDQTIVNGISRIGYMTGGTTARWVDEDMADVLTRQAVAFLERHRSRPFFLYFATHDIHVPRVPHPRFAGATGLGPRGDVIVQFDTCVGQILQTLDRLGRAGSTLVILSSDNGPVIDDGYRDQAVEKLGTHRPAGAFRGGKYSAFEGGTRVPFLVRWPDRVTPGVSEALISQVDFPATFAALTGQALGPGDAPDSINVLPAVLGDSPDGRDHLVEQAGVLGLRQGAFKYIEPGSGPRVNAATNTELGNAPGGQLYRLTDDPGETRDLASAEPGKVEELRGRLDTLRREGRSRP